MIGIYKITNKKNNKSYIGKSIHCGKRFDEHFNGNLFIDNIIREEGIENFYFEIIEVLKNENDILEKEDYYIKKYNTLYPNGYNKKMNTINNINKNNIFFEDDIFSKLKWEDYVYASKILSPASLKLFLYIIMSKNKNDINSKEYCDLFNLSDKTFRNSKKELEIKGYLKEIKDSIVFYSRPFFDEINNLL